MAVGMYLNEKELTAAKELLSALSAKAASSLSMPETALSSLLPQGDYLLTPGFCDVHVHLREPGFLLKEDIQSGTLAAAHGGYTAVCSMPNLSPAPDTLAHLSLQLEAIRKKAVIPVYPYGTITMEEKGECLSEMEAMAPYVVGFSDDGRGVQSDDMMRRAMETAKALGKMIVAHCEDNSLLHGGYIHDGAYAKTHGHRGISSESEWRQVARDLELVAKVGGAYHVCHISAKETVAILREAKKSGLDVTCETGPHYLLLDDGCLEEHGRFKMNPPLRSPSDREALVEGILDGTIDMIATDHAPHTAEEKSRGLEKSLMGVVGIETAFPVLYTGLCQPGILPLERLIALLSDNPRRRFGIQSDRGFALFRLGEERVDPASFLSKGRSTPFEGMAVAARCVLTACEGKAVYRAPDLFL